MRDRLHVCRTVSILNEESLIVLEPIRSTYHRIVEPIGVKVFESLADALLEARRGDDFQVLLGREPLFLHRSPGRLNDELEVVQLSAHAAGYDDLALPVGAIVGEKRAHGIVSAPVAADGLQRGRDVLDEIVDADPLGHLAAESRAGTR